MPKNQSKRLISTLRNPLPIALAATSLFMGSSLYAEEAVFNNFLLRSPSIVSPSQNYQVKQGRFEAYIGSINATVDPKAANTKDIDTNGTEVGVGALYALNPMAVIGIDVDYENKKSGSENANATEIVPSVAFTLTPIFSLGIAAHLVSGTEDVSTGGDRDTSFNTFAIGATMHQDLWEATLAFNTESKDDNKPQNNSAQSFVLHGRYRIMPAMALGLSVFQRDTSSLAPSQVKAEDETGFGLHLEAKFSDVFTGEFALLSTTDVDGASGDDQSEFIAMLQYQVDPAMQLGARVSYLTSSGKAADVKAVRPGIFLTSYF